MRNVRLKTVIPTALSLLILSIGCSKKTEPAPSVETLKLPVCQGTFDFTNASSVPLDALRGFSVPESFGRWSDANEASFTCVLPSKGEPAPSTMRVTTSGFVFAGHTQKAVVFLNGSKVEEEQYLSDKPPKVIELPVPKAPGEKLSLKFSLPDAVSPKELGLNQDTRKIAISVQAIEFN